MSAASAMPAAEPASATDAALAAPGKPARVFRLEPAVPLESGAVSLPTPPVPDSPVGAEPLPARPTRRRRSPDQRPGPVLHAVLPVPPAPPETPASPQRLKELGLALARLDPVFEEIARARSFVFVDAQFDPAWKALSKQADSLHAELHAPRPWHR